MAVIAAWITDLQWDKHWLLILASMHNIWWSLAGQHAPTGVLSVPQTAETENVFGTILRLCATECNDCEMPAWQLEVSSLYALHHDDCIWCTYTLQNT